VKKYWFGPKESDFGVKSWEGWIAVLLFLVGFFAIRRYVAPVLAPSLHLTIVRAGAVLTLAWIAAFLVVAKLFYDPET
jgi:hypothetical protein